MPQIQPKHIADFFNLGKNAASGMRYIPEPDSELTAELQVIQNGLSGKHLNTSLFKHLIFTGAAAAGQITLTGTAIGDVVVNVVNLTTPANAEAAFESVISVANKIVQISASNLSANKYLAILIGP
jgi:hypothetical protein